MAGCWPSLSSPTKGSWGFIFFSGGRQDLSRPALCGVQSVLSTPNLSKLTNIAKSIFWMPPDFLLQPALYKFSRSNKKTFWRWLARYLIEYLILLHACYRLLLAACTRSGQLERRAPPTPIRTPERSSHLGGQMRGLFTQPRVTLHP